MGCDWSKTSSSVDDVPNAPYTLLSVSVEENVSYQGTPQGKGRSRKRGVALPSGSKSKSKIKADEAQSNNSEHGIATDSPSEPGGTKIETKPAKPKLDISTLKPLPASSKTAKGPEKGAGEGSVPGSLGGGQPPRPKISLDISKTLALPREQTEQQQRFEKLKRYESECTKVNDLLYVSGIKVAENRELLAGVGITHVVNCAGITTPNYFPDLFQYKTLYIHDEPSANLVPHMYDVLEFIDGAKKAGGKVLVHCTQGVSRSCSFCIAYMMLNHKASYEEGYGTVKAKRGICNPNAGFSAQLVLWGRRIAQGPSRVVRRPRAFAVKRYYTELPEAGVVAILIEDSRHAMESTLVYLVDTEDTVFVWAGSQAGSDAQTVAKRFAEQLARYEGSSNKLEVIVQGSGDLPAPLSSALEEMCCSLPQAASAAAVEDGKEQAKAPSFPQGGASCAVATPRGERPAMPPMGLKLPSAAAPAVTPVKEEENQPNQAGWGNDGGEKKGVCTGGDGDDASTDEDGGAVRMFEAPSWEEVENFDSDDLWPEKAFVLISSSGKASVWVGSEFDDAGDDVEAYAKKAADECSKASGVMYKEVETVADGDESDEFWDLFQLG